MPTSMKPNPQIRNRLSKLKGNVSIMFNNNNQINKLLISKKCSSSSNNNSNLNNSHKNNNKKRLPSISTKCKTWLEKMQTF